MSLEMQPACGHLTKEEQSWLMLLYGLLDLLVCEALAGRALELNDISCT